jgi:uncharacterized protein (TIRG00374 family)
VVVRKREPLVPAPAGGAPTDPALGNETNTVRGDEVREEIASKRGPILLRLLFFTLTAIALYILWPRLLQVFKAWPQLLSLNPGWFLAMFGLEIASFVCAWGLQRIALRTDKWFGVATAQLASNAFSRIVPGGAAAGGALQFRMLTESGVPAATVGTGLTAASLISTGTLLLLPVLTLPAALAGRPTPRGLAQAAWLGAGVFVLGFVAGWVLLTRERAVRKLGETVQWLRNRLVRRAPPTTDLPDRLVRERNEILRTLGARWWQALLLSLGNWLFDYLALLAALTAVGTRPRPTLVLLAYVASMVLSMIPITPGGLGFVEAGLTGLLALAGVGAGRAVLATLAYRLVSYWLPLPLGIVAGVVHRRHYARRRAAAV